MFIWIVFFALFANMLPAILYAPYNRYMSRMGGELLEEPRWFNYDPAINNARVLRGVALRKNMGAGLIVGLVLCRILHAALWLSVVAFLVSLVLTFAGYNFRGLSPF